MKAFTQLSFCFLLLCFVTFKLQSSSASHHQLCITWVLSYKQYSLKFLKIFLLEFYGFFALLFFFLINKRQKFCYLDTLIVLYILYAAQDNYSLLNAAQASQGVVHPFARLRSLSQMAASLFSSKLVVLSPYNRCTVKDNTDFCEVLWGERSFPSKIFHFVLLQWWLKRWSSVV